MAVDVVIAGMRILLAKRPPWGEAVMRRLARANDNGGVYYIAKTRRTVADLERLFRQREVAILLEENVGSIIGGVTQPGTLVIQLSKDATQNQRVLEDIQLCLSELRVELLEPATNTTEIETWQTR